MSRKNRVPFGGAASARSAQDEDEDLEVEEADQEVVEREDEPSEASETTETPAVEDAGPVVAPKAVMAATPVRGPKLVNIKPRQDVPRVRIGGAWYSFRKGVCVDVPEDVRRVLDERGLI